MQPQIKLNALAVDTIISVDVTGGSNITLTASQSSNGILRFFGVLSVNVAVIVPLTHRQYTVINDTTGAFTLTVRTNAGTGVVVPQTDVRLVIADGVNVRAATSTTLTPPPSVLRDYMSGFECAVSSVFTSGDGIRIAPGQCANGGLNPNTDMITLSAPIDKAIGTWAQGSGVGGVDTATFKRSCTGGQGSFSGSVFTCTVAPTFGRFDIGDVLFYDGGVSVIASYGTASPLAGGTGTYNLQFSTSTLTARPVIVLSWYNVYVIKNPTTGVVDAVLSRSPTFNNVDASVRVTAGFSQGRWVGVALAREDLSRWRGFNQFGDIVILSNAVMTNLYLSNTITAGVPMFFGTAIPPNTDATIVINHSANAGIQLYQTTEFTPLLANNVPVVFTADSGTTIQLQSPTSGTITHRVTKLDISRAKRLNT